LFVQNKKVSVSKKLTQRRYSRVTTLIHPFLAKKTSLGLNQVPFDITVEPVATYTSQRLQRTAHKGILRSTDCCLSPTDNSLKVLRSVYYFCSLLYRIKVLLVEILALFFHLSIGLLKKYLINFSFFDFLLYILYNFCILV